MSKLVNKAARLLFDRRGPLTQELLRSPGGFGLGQVPARLVPDATTRSVCGFCSTGCALDVHLKDGEAINITPSQDYSVNQGVACPKGWEALTPLSADDRAHSPMVRSTRGKLEPVSWQRALEVFCSGFRSIIEKHGPESVAFLSTGQITTEEMALLGALTKFGMGWLHGDGNTRQCMATAAVAYKQSFGFDAPPYTYADFEASDVLVFVGANPCIAHPILWEHVCKNPNAPEIIVVDPRKTETAMAATQHLRLRPKSDLVLFYAIACLLIERGAIDRQFIEQHTEGFDAFAEHVKAFTLDQAAQHSGLNATAIEKVVDSIAHGKRVSFWWTMGVNQSHEGVRLAQALINLALITGNIGRPGTGANSITGQCNAMGSRLFSNTTNLLGGHDFANEDHRSKVAGTLGLDPSAIPAQGSWAYDQIIEGIVAGKIKGLWIIATNTAHSWINQADLEDALGRLDLLVVQDMYSTTETANFADLVLPAAGWGEKTGTFINSERRIGLIKKVRRAPGEALADFSIFKLIAEAWGCAELFERWSDPEATLHILTELSRGQPCDITGIDSYAMLEKARGIQWPLPHGQAVEPQSQRRLFEDGQFYHASGRAKLVFGAPRAPVEQPDQRFPMTLLTGRGSSSQWHTQTRTSKSSVLKKLYPEDAYVEISPTDSKRLGIEPNSWVMVESRRGKMKARAFITHVVQPATVFVPMHYARTNQLTFPAFDPYSRQPSYKYCAVKVYPATV